MEGRPIVIVDGVRSAQGRASKKKPGSLAKKRVDDLAAELVKKLLERNPQVDPKEIEDLQCGCAFPEAEQGMNIAKNIALLAGLPIEVAGATTNRFCGSSMQTTHQLAFAMACGAGDIAISVGVESMSQVPMGGNLPQKSINAKMMQLKGFWGGLPPLQTMPQTAQNVADEWGVSRGEMDRFSAQSHRRAHGAHEEGRFKDEIVPVEVKDPETGEKRVFDRDETIRPGTTAEKLAELEPIKGVFSARKNPILITAGNSCPTNDGASALLLMTEEKAKELGLKPLARIRSAAVAGIDPVLMGAGPIPASRKAMKRAGVTVNDIGLAELNEAFAAQSLACAKDLGIDEAKLNVNGGAIAIGHPLGCSGARLLVTLTHEMKRRSDVTLGLATMCIGGGMGIATIVEKVEGAPSLESHRGTARRAPALFGPTGPIKHPPAPPTW